MRTFKDKNGLDWTIDLNVGDAMRVRRADARFDLFDCTKEVDGVPLPGVLFDDVPTFWELLYLLVKPQADERGINAEAFGALMSAEALVKSQFVFFDEWRDFFRDLQQPTKAMALEKTVSLRRKQIDLMEATAKSPRIAAEEARIVKRMETAMSESLGKLGEASESTPEDSRSAN
jgi:hypothetical protein